MNSLPPLKKSAKRKPGDVILSSEAGSLIVAVAEDAQMSCPTGELEWQMRYGDPVKVRMLVAGVLDSYEYLVCHCSKEEAWRRIKIMREAVRKYHSEKTR